MTSTRPYLSRLCRWGSRVVATTAALVLVASVAGWGCSAAWPWELRRLAHYQRFDSPGNGWGANDWNLIGNRHCLFFQNYDSTETPERGRFVNTEFEFEHDPSHDFYTAPFYSPTRSGRPYATSWSMGGARFNQNPTNWGVAIAWPTPIALSSLVLLLWGVFAVRRYRRRHRGENVCESCGYDLTGSVGTTCPECGGAVGSAV